MGIQTFIAQGRSNKTISMIKWIRTSRFSIKKPLSALLWFGGGLGLVAVPPRPISTTMQKYLPCCRRGFSFSFKCGTLVNNLVGLK